MDTAWVSPGSRDRDRRSRRPPVPLCPPSAKSEVEPKMKWVPSAENRFRTRPSGTAEGDPAPWDPPCPGRGRRRPHAGEARSIRRRNRVSRSLRRQRRSDGQRRACFIEIRSKGRRCKRVVRLDCKSRSVLQPSFTAAGDVGVDASIRRVPGSRNRTAVDAIEHSALSIWEIHRRGLLAGHQSLTRRRNHRCPRPKPARRPGNPAAVRLPPAA